METLELSEQRQERERAVAQVRHRLELVDRQPNVEDRLAHLRSLLDTGLRGEAEPQGLALGHAGDEVETLRNEIEERIFELEGIESTIARIEERLGQDESEAVNLTLQQTLDVVDHLRQVSQSAPNDERIGMVATNICEGLESFVTSVLSFDQAEEGSPGVGPAPADLELALEVIDTIGTCPGPDRRAIIKSLRRLFVDAAYNAVWLRVNRLFEMDLEPANRKQMLHEALSIWTITPELGESAGSPRLSQLPSEILRTIDRVVTQEIIGKVPVGEPEKLLDASILAREFSDDYVTMIPAIQVAEARTSLRAKLANVIARKLAHEISHAKSWHDLEVCIGVRNIVTSIADADAGEDARMVSLSRQIVWSTWRLRIKGVGTFFRGLFRPALITAVGLFAAVGLYVGIATLIKRLYDVGVPLAL